VPSPPAAQQREKAPPQAAASGETGAPTEVRAPLGATPIPVAGPEQESRRKEIGEAFAALKGKTHFQILELDGSATDSQIKEAYFRLARRFHPDVLRGPAYADLGDQIKAIFIRLGQAYEVLRNHDRRAQYQSTLSKRAPTPSAPAPAPTETGGAPVAVPVPPSAANLEIDAQLAANAIRQAEKLLEQERYWDAIQLVEGHFEHAAPKVRARARVVLAKCYLKNPNWAKRAEEQLLALVAEEPKHVEGHYLLGTIYREKGMRSRALARMKKVLELEPDHEEARARAAELEPPPEPEEPSGGGFVKRLFGRGGGSGA
jgi:tetratricopeptide (TPR) repeat protein